MTRVRLRDDEFYLIDPERYDRGQTVLLLGSSYTGKSTLLVHSLEEIVEKNIYDVIVLMTESISAEPLKNLPEEVILLQGYHPELVQMLAKINNATKNRYRVLIVLDDCCSIHNSKTLEKQVLIYRNANISTIISTQYPKLLSPAMRSSVHRTVLTGSKSSELRMQIEKLFMNHFLAHFSRPSRERFLINNTTLNPKDGKPKVIVIDNVKDELFVQYRPST